VSSVCRTIRRSIDRVANLSGRAVHFQPSHELRFTAYQNIQSAVIRRRKAQLAAQRAKAVRP
jgi:hypothetical protein